MTPKDYIIFPLDVPDFDQAKKYINLLSGKVGIFKIGLELFISAGPEIIKYIKDNDATEIFLDLKLHDIPATVFRAVNSVAKMGVKFLTIHCSDSQTMVKKAVEGSNGQVGILGVTVLTSIGNEDILDAGFKELYYKDINNLVLKRADMAQEAGCTGIVCSGLEVKQIKNRPGNKLLAITPGIRPKWAISSTDDQRRITTPAEAIRNGSDYLVIGRPIRDADDPVEAVYKTCEEIQMVI